MKKVTIVFVTIIITIGLYLFFTSDFLKNLNDPEVTVNQSQTSGAIFDNTSGEIGDSTVINKDQTIIGKSVEGRDITAYHFGGGDTELLFVGGIHGGYEWNTVLVANELMSYLKKNPSVVPVNVKVTVIPVLNPDGLNKVVGTAFDSFSQADIPASEEQVIAGRFNSNNVDLNRNFDCDWQSEGKWQNKKVSGGNSAFSEPESVAMRDYVKTSKPSAVVVWYSAAGGVFASSCHNGVSAETNTLTQKFAEASGYKAYQDFNFYEITGDMVNWLAKENVPAISVLLTNHTDIEWTKNLAGVQALLKYYTK